MLPESLEDEGENVYRATSLSPSLTMDPHEDRDDCPRLLMEVADGSYGVRTTATTLLLEVSNAAVMGINAIRSLEDVETDKACYCETSFGMSEKGFANIREYMDIMKKMYARVAGRPLCTQDGRVRTWPAGKARLPRCITCI